MDWLTILGVLVCGILLLPVIMSIYVAIDETAFNFNLSGKVTMTLFLTIVWILACWKISDFVTMTRVTLGGG